MKLVAMLNQFPKFSETFIVNKLTGLLAAGWDVHVICKRSDASQWKLFPQLESQFMKRVQVASDKATALSALKALRPDIVHFEFANLAPGYLSEIGGDCHIVVSFRGPDINFVGLDTQDFYQEVWDRADGLHFLGSDLFQRAVRRGCPTDIPHGFISPAIDTAYFTPEKRPAAGAVGRPRRPYRILSVGRIHWTKGYEYALHAIKSLAEEGVACEYRIIGGADYQEAKTQLYFTIHDLGLERQVQLLGAQPRAAVRENLSWADVFLHSAVSEGFCNSVIEAQSMAVPVVCTDADGLSENVEHSASGFVVSRRNYEQIHDMLDLLRKNGNLRRRMGEAGYQRVREKFELKQQIQSFDSFYRDVIEMPAKAGIEQPAPELAPILRLDALQRRLQSTAAVVLPDDASVAVISKGDDSLVQLGNCLGWHFPQNEDGVYAGYHPADNSEAIDYLENIRVKGADFLLIPSPHFWWLDHYAGFKRHLKENYRLHFYQDDLCLIFDLKMAKAC